MSERDGGGAERVAPAEPDGPWAEPLPPPGPDAPDECPTEELPAPFADVVALASLLAPPRHRASWRREWRSELWYALSSGRSRVRLLWRTLWCWIDALWLWRREVAMMTRGWEGDFKVALRSAVRTPMLSAVIVLTLAVGIGTNAALFSVTDAVLWRDLPLPEPDRLVRFSQERPANGQVDWGYSYAMYRGLTDRLEQARLAAYSLTSFNVVGADGPERLTALRVSDTFFPVLGRPLAMGRSFTREEEAAGLDLLVVSHEFWRDFLGASPDALGHTVTLGARPFEVIGVLAPGLDVVREMNRLSRAPDDRIDLYVPLETFGAMQADLTTTIQVIGRMGDGRTIQETHAAAFDFLTSFLAERGASGWETEVVSLHERLTGNARGPLLLLLGAVGVLLVMVCANLAGLMLVRGVGRGLEWSARRALGATRLQVGRQLVTEGAVLAIAGGTLGLVVAGGLVRLFAAHAPSGLPRAEQVGLDLRATAFSFLLAITTAALFTLLPALSAARSSPAEALTRSRQTLSRGARRTLKGLVGVQVTLAVVLLAGSGVLVRSLSNLLEQDPGFSAESVLQGAVNLPADRYPDDEDVRTFARDVQDRLAALSEVSGVAVASVPQPTLGPRIRFQREDVEGQDGLGGALQSGVTPEYFDVLDIDIERGRPFDASDRADGPPVAIITPALARRYWPGEDPLGKRVLIGSWRTFFTLGTSTTPVSREIIGITEEITNVGIDPGPPAEMLFAPFVQDPWTAHAYLVRTHGEPANLAAEVRAAVTEADPSQPAYAIYPLLDDLRTAIERERLSTVVLVAFGIAALFLSALGIYGVVAYSVLLRRREIGIRVALGADRGSVSRLFFLEGLGPVVAGGVLGFGVALLAVRALRGLLYQVEPVDPAAFLAAGAILVGAALASCYLPARRTARVDPVEAMRPD